MKRKGRTLLAAMLSLAMTMTALPALPAVTAVADGNAGAYLLGDLNFDHDVSATDLTVLARFLGQIAELPVKGYQSDGRSQYKLGDLDLDGAVKATDLTILSRHVGGVALIENNGIYGYKGIWLVDTSVIQQDNDGTLHITMPLSITNPVIDSGNADPDLHRFQVDGKDTYWIYGTGGSNIRAVYSDDNMTTWQRCNDDKGNVLDLSTFPWVKSDVWAPGAIEHNGKYYLVFSANNVPDSNRVGGIGIGVADHPGGPFTPVTGTEDGLLLGAWLYGVTDEDDDAIFREKMSGKPTLIDASFFRDDDGTIYLYYGGGQNCGVCIMKDDMSGIRPFEDGDMYKVITKGLTDYVEGPFMIKRGGTYYMMYSKGSWYGGSYASCYAVSDSPIGPFSSSKQITRSSPDGYPYNGPGHNSALYLPENNMWLFCYHRYNYGSSSRFPCIEPMFFNEDGSIRPILMTDSWTTEDDFGPDTSNLALEATPIDCGRSQYGVGSVFSLNDGDRSTYWQPNDGAGSTLSNMWAGLDFGEATTFNQVYIEWESDTICPEDGFVLQTSNDGEIWTDLSDVVIDYGTVTTFAFPNTQVRYVRVNMTKGTNDKYCPKIFEMEVRNTAAQEE